jgi:archaeal type IV pilus assembly protein PilA
MLKMNRNEDAVSPVIGVILMVAITVILAAVIAAFVFGMGAPETAPQASIRGSADAVGVTSAIMLEHQGGDAIDLIPSITKVTIDGTEIDYYNVSSGDKFEAGETLYLGLKSSAYTIGNSSSANVTDDYTTSTTYTVKFIDVSSQQMIADMDVRF